MIGLQPTPTASGLLLGSAAAGSCPVKTHNTFDRTVPVPESSPATELPPRVQAARAFEAQLLAALVETAPGLVVDLRLLSDDPAASADACLRAMTVGAEVVVGGTLPADRRGHRTGRPDLLVRGLDSPDGRPTYHPAEVKAHKVLLAPRRSPRDDDGAPSPAVLSTPLHAPRPLAPRPLEGTTLRLGSREADFLQLAHSYRMLQAAGFAAERPLGGVIGTDTVLDGPVLAWADLAEPTVRTFSRSAEQGWRLRSLLERYDHEHALRLDVARTAARRTGDPTTDPTPLVQPVVQRECGHCFWWSHCRMTLPDDDVSLRIDKGALDVREVLALRRHGVLTVPELAQADLDTLLPQYLPEVTHRAGAERRLRVAGRRARMLLSGVPFDRETDGPITVPGAEVEVDLDIESSADGRIYLWGFLLNDTAQAGERRYVAFSRFDDLDDATETALAVEAFRWLRTLVETSGSVRVYHYSAYEPSTIRALASRAQEPELDWAAAHADELVDLYEVVKAHFFGASGLGLKPIAQHAGFRWRDDDPGGLNSQAWFADAVHHPEAEVRDRARQRVLEYNEDDVLATHELRAWLRSR
jgi:predicted RecB family nuclease